MGLEVFYAAFWDLVSEAPPSFDGVGDIPWSKIMEWADRAGLDDAMRDDLLYHIRHMDMAWKRVLKSKVPRKSGKGVGDGDGQIEGRSAEVQTPRHRRGNERGGGGAESGHPGVPRGRARNTGPHRTGQKRVGR